MLASLFAAPRKLLGSLASRIGFFVFAATLLSALVVAGTSAFAVRAFLRGKVEDRIPEAVRTARDQLDLWYAQRSLDVEIFAHSGILVEGLTRMARVDAASRDRAEIEQYLGYVRDEFPLYSSIVAFDSAGRELASAGAAHGIAPNVRRQLSKLDAPSISGVLIAHRQARVQAVSAPVTDVDGRRVATLHAIFPLAELQKHLAESAEKRAGRLLVFDAAGALVASSQEAGLSAISMPAALESAPAGGVRDYPAPGGERVAGSAMPFARLPWQIVFEGDYGATFAPIASILRRTLGLNLVIVLVLAMAAFAIARALLRPLHALSECAVRLRDGETGVALPAISREDEVGILTRSFGEMVESLTRANEALEQLAITDGLTKIHNHRFFQDRLASAIQRCENTGAPLSLALIDIDDFKALNDRFGHVAGDSVLEQLASLLVAEAGERDVVARYGGEEFVVLAPDCAPAAAIALAERIRLRVHAHAFRASPDTPIAVSVSIGVSGYQGDRQRFFVAADNALYAAKSAGKDCVMAAPEA